MRQLISKNTYYFKAHGNYNLNSTIINNLINAEYVSALFHFHFDAGRGGWDSVFLQIKTCKEYMQRKRITKEMLKHAMYFL